MKCGHSTGKEIPGTWWWSSRCWPGAASEERYYQFIHYPYQWQVFKNLLSFFFCKKGFLNLFHFIFYSFLMMGSKQLHSFSAGWQNFMSCLKICANKQVDGKRSLEWGWKALGGIQSVRIQTVWKLGLISPRFYPEHNKCTLLALLLQFYDKIWKPAEKLAFLFHVCDFSCYNGSVLRVKVWKHRYCWQHNKMRSI